MTAWILVLVVGCAGDPGRGPGDAATSYAGPAPRRWTFAPQGDPADDDVLWIEARDGAWSVRGGPRWEGGTELEVWPVLGDGALVVDGTEVLPARVEVGAASAHATVIEVGPREVWYGTFDRVATVEVSEGPFAGEMAFAQGYGPVLFAWDPAVADVFPRTWELVRYEDVE